MVTHVAFQMSVKPGDQSERRRVTEISLKGTATKPTSVFGKWLCKTIINDSEILLAYKPIKLQGEQELDLPNYFDRPNKCDFVPSVTSVLQRPKSL